MKMILIYRDGTVDMYEEKDLDMGQWTMKGHASRLIAAWKSTGGIYELDSYNAVLLDALACVRVKG